MEAKISQTNSWGCLVFVFHQRWLSRLLLEPLDSSSRWQEGILKIIRTAITGYACMNRSAWFRWSGLWIGYSRCDMLRGNFWGKWATHQSRSFRGTLRWKLDSKALRVWVHSSSRCGNTKHNKIHRREHNRSLPKIVGAKVKSFALLQRGIKMGFGQHETH